VAVHEKRIAIRFRDLDAYGHVNQAVYQTFLEETLDDWMSGALGRGTFYVAARVAIDYRSELRLDDREVVGAIRLERVGTKSITIRGEVRAADGRLAAEAELVVVAWDPEARRSRPLTDEERAALEAAA
jgi:acyl-CoA thioester hydrolase